MRDLKLKADWTKPRCRKRSAPVSNASTRSSTKTADGAGGKPTKSHPFMTAYVVAGLAQAKAAGMQVKDDAIAKG